MRYILNFTWVFCLWVSAAIAETNNKYEQLFAALYLPEMVAVMRIEGLDYADEVAQTMLGDRAGVLWDAEVDQLYGQQGMVQKLTTQLQQSVSEGDLDVLLKFYQSTDGALISERELEARRALLSSEAEAEAHNLLKDMRDRNDPQLDLLETFIEQNHLVDRNLSGAMNASFEFYFGLMDSGAIPPGLTETEVLKEVWSQEDEIRSEIEDWLWAYQVLAYDGLQMAQMEVYLQFTGTPEGRALYQALFDSFDVVFRDLSRQLGRLAGQLLISEEI